MTSHPSASVPAPARPAAPADPRQASGSTSSGRPGPGPARRRSWRRTPGRSSTGCDPGGPSPYTPALEALGIPIASGTCGRPRDGTPPPDRLAVTKALTAIDPDHPELGAARDAGIPVEPWQQVVADAAVGRTLVAVAGTHGKSTTAGWLVHVLMAAGADPCAFVGALLPSSITGGPPATARWGDGRRVRRRGRRVRRQLRCLSARRRDPDHGRVGSPRRVPPTALPSSAHSSAGCATRRRDAVARGQCRRPGRRGAGRRLAAWPDGRRLRAGRPGAGAARRLRPRDRGAIRDRGRPRHGLDRPDHARTPTARPSRSHGLDPLAGSLDVCGSHRWSPQRRQRPRRRRCRAAAGWHRTPSCAASRPSRRRPSAGAQGRGRWGRGLRRLRAPPDGHPRDVAAIRQREPGRPVWAVYEPLTYPPDGGAARRFRRRARHGRRGRHRRYLGRPRPGHDHHVGRGARRRPSPTPTGMTAVAPGSVEATATWLSRAVHGGDAVLVMGGGRSYRIAELLLEALEATTMTRLRGGGELLERYGRAWETFDGDAWVALFTEEAEYHEDPFGSPLVGHNALRAYLLEAPDAGPRSSSRSSAIGSRAPRSSPAGRPGSSASPAWSGSGSPGS